MFQPHTWHGKTCSTTRTQAANAMMMMMMVVVVMLMMMVARRRRLLGGTAGSMQSRLNQDLYGSIGFFSTVTPTPKTRHETTIRTQQSKND